MNTIPRQVVFCRTDNDSASFQHLQSSASCQPQVMPSHAKSARKPIGIEVAASVCLAVLRVNDISSLALQKTAKSGGQRRRKDERTAAAAGRN